MMCPQCSAKTRVTASRSMATPGRGWEMKRAQSMVGWYTQDFVVRIRKCTQCPFSTFTVELPMEDIKGIMTETAEGNAPESLIHGQR